MSTDFDPFIQSTPGASALLGIFKIHNDLPVTGKHIDDGPHLTKQSLFLIWQPQIQSPIPLLNISKKSILFKHIFSFYKKFSTTTISSALYLAYKPAKPLFKIVIIIIHRRIFVTIRPKRRNHFPL